DRQDFGIGLASDVDHQPPGRTGEVGNRRSDHHLAVELEPAQLLIGEPRPQRLFGLARIAALRARHVLEPFAPGLRHVPALPRGHDILAIRWTAQRKSTAFAHLKFPDVLNSITRRYLPG